MKRILLLLALVSQSALATLQVEPFLGYTLNHELKSFVTEVSGIEMGSRFVYKISGFTVGLDYRVTDYSKDSFKSSVSGTSSNVKSYNRSRQALVLGYEISDWKAWYSYGFENEIKLVIGSAFWDGGLNIESDHTLGFGYTGYENLSLNFEYNTIKYLSQDVTSMTLSASLPINFFE